MVNAIHHIHQRKRIYQKHEEYPHHNKWKRILDTLLIVFAGVFPVTNIPQLFRIYVEKNVSGLSLTSWILYPIFTIPWIIYGFMHKEKLIMFAYTANFFILLAIVFGIVMYS